MQKRCGLVYFHNRNRYFETLIEQAENIECKDDFLMQVKNAKVASRGYKTAAALKKFQIDTVASDDDGTTQGFIRQLERG